jgi:hypothetical protein
VSRSPQGGRTRTIKPLAQIYEGESLPATAAPKPAETRVLAEMGVSAFVASLAQPRLVRRNHTTKPATA